MDFTKIEHIDELHRTVSRELSEKRLSHVVSVAKTAYRMCIELGLSDEETQKTVTGAYLHDITKEKTKEEHYDICRRHGIVLSEADMRSPEVLHQITGAPYASEKLPHLVCPTVYGAISKHCTGGKDMNIYEKIVFLADYIEPTRRQEHCKQLNDYFFNCRTDENVRKHLDKAVLLAYDNTVGYLTAKGGYIHPATLEGREQLITVNRERNG